ncbi:hypothetical protein M885DRAFT_225898 [Pelagophyceae sp. CCMP2097]|nr:hypothetical protein M885DRAFT_225898 [Pelagophyceae sp. CCMP2097]
MSEMLEQYDDLGAAVSEVLRVLKPGGVFIIDTIEMTPHSWTVCALYLDHATAIIPRNARDWRIYLSPEQLEVILTDAGFHVDARRGSPPADAEQAKSEAFVLAGPIDSAGGAYLWWAKKPVRGKEDSKESPPEITGHHKRD